MILYGRIGRPLEKKSSPRGNEYYLLTIAGNNERGSTDTNWYLVRAFLEEMDADMLGKGVFVRIPMGRLSSYAKVDNRTNEPTARLSVATWQIDQVEPADGEIDGKKVEAVVTGMIATDVEQKTDDKGQTYFEFDLVENHTRKREGSATWYKVHAYLDEVDGGMLERRMVVRLSGKPIPRHYKTKEGELKSSILFEAFSSEQVVSKKKEST